MFAHVSKVLMVWQAVTVCKDTKDHERLFSITTVFCEQLGKENLQFSQDWRLLGLAGNQVSLFMEIIKINLSSYSIYILSDLQIFILPETWSEMCPVIPWRRFLAGFNLRIKWRVEKSWGENSNANVAAISTRISALNFAFLVMSQKNCVGLLQSRSNTFV